MRKGVAASPGVAVGKAYCVDDIVVAPDDRKLGSREAAAEFRRFERARTKTAGELRALYHKVSSRLVSNRPRFSRPASGCSSIRR